MTRAGLTSVVGVGRPPSGGTATLVLIPGTNMSAAVSLHVAEALAETAPLVVLDVPGQPGLSSGLRPRRHRADFYGAWLADALERITDGPVVVVGHSLGAAIALACPSELIAGRVLVSPGGVVRLRVSASVVTTTLPWMLRPSPTRAERLLTAMTGPGRTVPPELSAWMALVGRSCRSSLAPAPLSARALGHAGSAPLLAVAGTCDTFLPVDRLGPAMERRLNTELRLLPDVGHLLPEEAPARLVGLVAEFLASVRPRH
ncbi:alpha/beta hydrolase [Streptomyces sp. NPDC051771]|uniref:alpha/beta fold hydrolase n=1 Tax=Streptomyces sp. NPDC051771 TaxID=3154847 RepID=UPI00344A14D3